MKLSRNRFRVTLFRKLMGLASALQTMPAKITPPPFRLMQIGSLFWQSRALYVATRLGVADVIANSQKSTREIASELELHEEHLYRLLRMLTSMGIFEESSPRVFRNSKTSDYLRRDNPQNVRAMILMHNSPEMTRPWMEPLEESMRDGEVPFEKAHNVDLFGYMDRNREFDILFSQAMDSVESLTGNAYLEDFDWDAFDRIIDVGGSRGSKSVAILKSAPNLKALVFDRLQVIEAARAHWRDKESKQVIERIVFQPGDMFESLPTATSDKDLYLFFAIFHGLSDEESGVVLGNLKSAIGTRDATVLIADCVAEEIGINPTVAGFDMQMLIGTRGRERTLSEWKRLLQHSGFRLDEVVDVRTFAKFIVARLVRTGGKP
ncbi:MAG: methyltransferase [Gammaproteobacteria bacterium]|jgi:DNA-binding Lrp family transcriptional regulator